MAIAPQYVGKKHYTEAEYFEFERTSFGRWEYVNGEIRQMSGGTTDHGAISSNIVRTLGNALVPRGCRVYGSDVRIHTGDGVNTFPYISVICNQNRYYSGRKDTVLNPLLIVEVLSPSTEDYDQKAKFAHYQTIETLTDYLLVEQNRARVLLYTRREDYWEFREVRGRESIIHLPSVGIDLALADVYTLIDFGAE